jgi:hypothetical protein
MNNSWDNFIYIFTHPYFLVILAFGMILPYILKLLRRFYPKSLQKIIIKSETFSRELEENEKDKELSAKIRRLEGSIIFIPASFLMLIYLIISYFNGVAFTPHFIFNSALFVFASAMFFSFGIYMLKGSEILNYILKDDYQRYLEIERTSASIDPIIKLFVKYKKIFSYIFISLGLLYFTMSIFPEYFK